MNTTQATAAGERADLLASLGERRYFLRYAGHADIIRESLDGAKTMG
ncbi:MAG TPA: hypothetical protein VEH31_12610 [Streptosporangiaceae bacterium]|nr:hypothetical protein [Streptosporangiaceae bacterium]